MLKHAKRCEKTFEHRQNTELLLISFTLHHERKEPSMDDGPEGTAGQEVVMEVVRGIGSARGI